MSGKKTWYVVDGYRPPIQPIQNSGYEGHECYMILNTNDVDANVNVSVYFTNKDPVENIRLIVPAKRVFAFRSSDASILGGLHININEQYSIMFSSDINIIVQYGRLDVQQPNLAYMALMGYSE